MHIDVLGVCLQKVHPKMNRIEDPDENQLKADVASSKYFYFYFTMSRKNSLSFVTKLN